MSKQSRQIIYSLAAATAFFLVCIAIQPDGLAANDGLSYYGSIWITILPFVAAMALYEYCLWRATKAFGHSHRYAFLAVSLKIMAILVIAVVVTPISLVDENLHSLFGLVLFILQFIVSVKMLTWDFHWIDAGLVGIEAVGFLAALYYASFDHGLLLQSQLVFQAAFLALFVRSLALLRIGYKRAQNEKNKKRRSS